MMFEVFEVYNVGGFTFNINMSEAGFSQIC